MTRISLAALLLWLASGAWPGACIPGLPPPDAEQPRRPALRLPALRAEPDPVAGGRIVDAHGREVLLRGVNVNAFVEYWAYDPALFTTYPFPPADADAIAGMGWNVVRLLLSWSRVEPAPGVYDEAYLDTVEAAVRTLEQRGIYTLIDLHQDAWSATLAARPGEACTAGPPAFGWDGAPAWATQDGGEPRCAALEIRELSPAVLAAFDAFWRDAPGPGGVGIRTRYARMLAHLAARFSRLDAVAGYDLMNEPNAYTRVDVLDDFIAEALAAIRAAETGAGHPHRLVFFEPSILWAGFGTGAPAPFPADDQIVYAPHVYQGGLDGQPLDAAVFARARSEAAAYGGAPVFSGEWGGDPGRASDPADGYFERHQSLQDAFRFGATLWTWREACGDPHKAGDARAGRVPEVWGLFAVDCARNEILGPREDLVAALRRPALRAAPGPIEAVAWDPAAGRFVASGTDARPGRSFFVFWPAGLGTSPRITSTGLRGVHGVAAPGGSRFVAGWARGGRWSLAIEAQVP
ncbi:MAG: cellulase family glycosylhydrolase [Deltaproteobacteria bacterium]|nr:cellulase family glycosylhydrolase [Deltaproteobacteria bacterium]